MSFAREIDPEETDWTSRTKHLVLRKEKKMVLTVGSQVSLPRNQGLVESDFGALSQRKVAEMRLLASSCVSLRL